MRGSCLPQPPPGPAALRSEVQCSGVQAWSWEDHGRITGRSWEDHGRIMPLEESWHWCMTAYPLARQHWAVYVVQLSEVQECSWDDHVRIMDGSWTEPRRIIGGSCEDHGRIMRG